MITLLKTTTKRARRVHPAVCSDAQRRFKRLRENTENGWRPTQETVALETQSKDIFDPPAATEPASFSWHRTWSYKPLGEIASSKTRYYKGRMYALNQAVELEDIYEGSEAPAQRQPIKFSDFLFLVSALLGYSGLLVCIYAWWRLH